MIYDIPSYAQTVNAKWPTREFAITGTTVRWLDAGEALDIADVDAARLVLTKSMAQAQVRAQAVALAGELTRAAIGSADMRQLYIYELKKEESLWLISSGAITELTDPAITPERRAEILNKVQLIATEAALTGTPVDQLAQAVLYQFELAQQGIHAALGMVEAARRNTLALIEAATSFADLDAIPEPAWPGLGDVAPF